MSARNNVFFCFLAMLCEGIDIQAAGVSAAGIAAELQPAPGVLGLFFSASTMGLFIGAPIGGWFGDRRGRKFAVTLALLIFGVFSLATALCTTMDMLTLARFLTGVGLGGALPNLIALTVESSQPEHRSRNVTLIYAATPLGGALISYVSVLSTPENWRFIFLFGGVTPLIVAALFVYFVAEPGVRAEPAAAPVSSGSRPGLVATLAAEGRALPTALLWLSFFFSLLLLYLLLNWLPLLLREMGLTPAQAAFSQILFNLGGAIGAASIGFLLDKKGRAITTALAYAALAGVLLVLANADTGLMMPLAFVLGAVILAVQAILYALAPSIYPRIVRGTGVGAAVAIGRLGSITGPLVAGTLLGAGQSGAEVLTGMLPIVGIAGVCAVLLSRTLTSIERKQ